MVTECQCHVGTWVVVVGRQVMHAEFHSKGLYFKPALTLGAVDLQSLKLGKYCDKE